MEAWSPHCLSFQSQKNRNRPVVDQLDVHVRAEHTGRHGGAQRAQLVGEGVDQWLGNRSGGRRRSTMAVAPFRYLRTA